MACKRSWLGQRVGGDLGARVGPVPVTPDPGVQ
jgi:hypothetical protein